MIRHNDKIVQQKLPGPHVGAQHVDRQCGVALRLQQIAAFAGSGGGEERAGRPRDILRVGIASRLRHRQGLEPDSFPRGTARLKSCPDTETIIRKPVPQRTSAGCGAESALPQLPHFQPAVAMRRTGAATHERRLRGGVCAPAASSFPASGRHASHRRRNARTPVAGRSLRTRSFLISSQRSPCVAPARTTYQRPLRAEGPLPQFPHFQPAARMQTGPACAT